MTLILLQLRRQTPTAGLWVTARKPNPDNFSMEDALWFVVGSQSDLLLQSPWEGIPSPGCGGSGT